ncbi:hypothetical protein [Palleronia sp.]|uniref:hypothetical protein n=1 Tax=Palleronia sp. TaxID=1940284 RepID=UPI0035C826F8
MLPIGQIALVIRMLLYPIAGWIAGTGFATFDRATGLLTFDVSNIAQILAGLVIYAVAWIWSRIASARGGVT